MRLHFTKMHGLGNDFVMIDAISRPVSLSEAVVGRLGHRHFGIGFDQLLMAVPEPGIASGVGVRIYNGDGSLAEQCGNGMRCFARFARSQGLIGTGTTRVMSPGGPVELDLSDDALVRVGMGQPVLEPALIPFVAADEAPEYAIEAGSRQLRIGAVSMGNPHAVVPVDDVNTAPVDHLGPAVAASGRFPEGVNVGFREVVGRGQLRLRVHERGVGETLACGSGACAAVVAGVVQGLLDDVVAVDLPGGRLRIEWAGRGHQVWMTGPTERVFEGELDL